MEKQDNDQKIRHLQNENRRLNGENLRLQRAIEELGILNEIAITINSTLALDKILDMIVQRCLHHLRAEQGAVLLLEEQKTEKPFQTICRTAQNIFLYKIFQELGRGWTCPSGLRN